MRFQDLPGEGPPIVLLHGALDSAAVWARVAPRLQAAGRRVLVASQDDERDPSPRAASWDLYAAIVAMDRRDPPAVHVVGHSRGGTAACWLAVEDRQVVRSVTVVASPPQASEAFRATFRRKLERAQDERERHVLEYLSRIPDEDFPTMSLRAVPRRFLVVEYEDDPLYSPTHTMFWRMFVPYASFERVPSGHRAFADSDESAAWLADRILRHVEEDERAA